jgi:hypothetical protein
MLHFGALMSPQPACQRNRRGALLWVILWASFMVVRRAAA